VHLRNLSPSRGIRRGFAADPQLPLRLDGREPLLYSVPVVRVNLPQLVVVAPGSHLALEDVEFLARADDLRAAVDRHALGMAHVPTMDRLRADHASSALTPA
jgi:hypothetical protein